MIKAITKISKNIRYIPFKIAISMHRFVGKQMETVQSHWIRSILIIGMIFSYNYTKMNRIII